jgi:hypothetical protein
MPAQAPDFTYSCQASTEHFQQRAEFSLFRNRGLGPLAVTVLAIALARRAAATACAAVQPTAPFFRRWRPLFTAGALAMLWFLWGHSVSRMDRESECE